MQKAGDLDHPFARFRLYIKLIANINYTRCFYRTALVLDPAFVARVCSLAPRLEQTDAPQVFIDAQFFVSGFHSKVKSQKSKFKKKKD
jgi:hypothetical protein